MTKTEDYRRKLHSLTDWTPYLLRESGLPGPRGNLELAHVVAEHASVSQVEDFLSIPPERAPENSAQVFLVFCGVTALGRWVARGRLQHLRRLRTYASDPRWRVREAVAIALQYVGDSSMKTLLQAMQTWRNGTWYEKRAVVAALAEPRLLKDPAVPAQVLDILDALTADMESARDPTEESFKVLRQTMGYAWSVVVVAAPTAGRPLMEKWFKSPDPNVRWIMKENLKKSRLTRMDEKWVRRWAATLQG
jgi:hypothetical protein